MNIDFKVSYKQSFSIHTIHGYYLWFKINGNQTKDIVDKCYYISSS